MAVPSDPNRTRWQGGGEPTAAAPSQLGSQDPNVTRLDESGVTGGADPGTTRLVPPADDPQRTRLVGGAGASVPQATHWQGEPPPPTPAGDPQATRWQGAPPAPGAPPSDPDVTRLDAPQDRTRLDAPGVTQDLLGPTTIQGPSTPGVDSALAAALGPSGGLGWGTQGAGLSATRLPGTPAASGAQAAPPQRVGRYTIERELARGGMGTVFQAHDPQLGRPVALKLMHQQSPAYARRFQVEAQAAARLDHPHIVAVYDAGEDQGRPFLVMALIDGESLQARLEREGPFEPEEAVRIGIALADALTYAHSHDVLHRDLKPENVLITRSGRPQLTDFGLAKLTAGGALLTQPGTIMGTPAFMAPEQARGETRRIDQRADVYGLGALIYALLTGRPPVEGATSATVLEQVAAGRVVDPLRIRPSLPRPLAEVVLRCLRLSPGERFPTALALRRALEQARGRCGLDLVEEPGERSPAPAEHEAFEHDEDGEDDWDEGTGPPPLAAQLNNPALLVGAAVLALILFTYLGYRLSRPHTPAPAVSQPAAPAPSPSAAASPSQTPEQRPPEGYPPPPLGPDGRPLPLGPDGRPPPLGPDGRPLPPPPPPR